LLLYPISYLLFMAGMKATFDRNLLVVIPFIAIAVGYWAGTFFQVFDRRRTPRAKPGHSWLMHVLGLSVFVLIFAQPFRQTIAAGVQIPRYGQDTRTQLMRSVRETLAHEGSPNAVWIIRESLIHPEETKGFERRFLFVGAEEAWQRWQRGDRPGLLITAELEGYPPAAMGANLRLMRSGKIVQSLGGGPVKTSVYVGNPHVVALRPSRPGNRN